jgi:predicted amidohydrolase
MRIVIAQIKVVPNRSDLAANHATITHALREIADSGRHVDVVVTPECFLDGYISAEPGTTLEHMKRCAIQVDNSPYAAEVARWARQSGAWVVLGCMRHAPEQGGVCNSALIYDRQGRLAGVYDKVHCQNHDRKFVAGSQLPVFDGDFGKFAVMICADRRWPETVRTLALRGARIIFNPTYGMCGQFNTQMMRVRSYESEVFIAFTHPKHSLITDPRGEVVCDEVSDAVAWTTTEVDLSEADAARGRSASHLRDRRPELYER